MKPFVLSTALFSALALLAGCSNLSVQAPAKAHYVLGAAGQPVCRPDPVEATLLVDALTPDAFYAGTAMAFSRAPGQRGNYQYAQWTGRPALRIAQLARERLRDGCLYRRVALTGEGVQGDHLLTLRLAELYHAAETSPGQTRLVIEAQLVQRATGRMLAQKTFDTSVPAPSYDAQGAATAANAALAQALDGLADWIAQQRPAGAGR